MKALTFLPLAMLLGAALPSRAADAADMFFQPNERVVFLGDSITQDGRYVAYFDLLLRSRFPQSQFDLVPLGLASETISGLSENDHPWPRPCVQERIDRVLEKAKPKVVCLCYGMNDGIYHPFSPERFAKYQEAFRLVVGKIRAAGAKVVILTPPPFDAPSFGNPQALQPEGRPDYGYRMPFAGYNEVLVRYGQWLQQEPSLADLVVNLNAPLTAFLARWRQQHPDYKSGDGVHPDALLHWLMARELALAAGVAPEVASYLNDGAPDSAGGFSFEAAAPAPLPRDSATPDGAWDAASINPAINRWLLTITHPDRHVYLIKSGERILGSATRSELASGLDLTRFPALSPNRDAAEALAIALQRHRMLSGSWREHVGHKRPDTDRQVLPLDQALAKAAEMEKQLSALLAPRAISVRVEPAPCPPSRIAAPR
jgi:lysophospholipase L1-like esterase